MSTDAPTLHTRKLVAADEQVKRHALLCSTGFIILLPLGALVGRYLRTFTRNWFWAHWIIQFLISGPVIFAGWALGYKSTNGPFRFTGGNWFDPHKKIGLSLLILYLFQLTLGVVIHFAKTPSFMGGRRPPQNYLHAFLGLVIIALAFYQVHYGITIEWYEATIGSGTIVPASALHAWTALIVIFWALYAIGLLLLPRQYAQEAAVRKPASEK